MRRPLRRAGRSEDLREGAEHRPQTPAHRRQGRSGDSSPPAALVVVETEGSASQALPACRALGPGRRPCHPG